MAETYTPRLRTLFDQVVRGKLTEQFGYKNPMQVPNLDKVVVNMGIGEGVNDRKKVEAAAADLSLITGQKAVITRRENRSRPSRCARARRSAARSPCARSGCTSSWIAS